MISGEGEFFTLERFDGSDEEVRAQWLAEREKGIGGSDVAAVMGLSPWRSPYETWCEKTGLAQPEDISDKPAVYWGNKLESLVGDEYRKRHPDRTVRRVNAMCRSIEAPWAQASLDYEVRDPELGWGVLEIKTAGLRSTDHWEHGAPVFYLTQIAHYLRVTGRPFADVAVLIGGQDFREYRYLREDLDVDLVAQAVDTFWNVNVLTNKEPDAIGGDGPALFEAHPDGGELLELDETPAILSRYRLACVEFDQAKAEKEHWAAKLKQEIGDDKGWKTPAGKVVWQRGERSRFDGKRFKADHPELNEEYTTTSKADGGLRFYPAKD